ncbi:MAG TPA: insulinase family protein [Hyphomicrobiales bacterium]|nr:insulinase family protein [Hyphomicrobiales bacterium]
MSAPRRPAFALLLSLCLLTLGACQSAVQDVQDDIVKSPRDVREYRSLVLDNGLRVLLISDPATEKAAAAVDVDAGSNADPATFPGLAHFLEHMLFLGTDQYPEAGEYQEFISRHGGSHNAYTAYENTNYYFDIERSQLEPALARFSRFFVAPLFTPAYVDRERNAVHSEYQSGLQDDGRRGYSVLKDILNPAHPLARFSVGSLDTLRDHDGLSLRQALLAHYDRYYSANLMSAAILGGESLDELEVLARRYFAAVPNRARQAPQSSAPLFAPGTLPAQLDIVPVRDARSLGFTFPIPDMRPYYHVKPLNYLGNLLGHEGKGSLLALLRERGWANGLSAGGGFGYRDASTFSVDVALTAEGEAHVDDIAALLFQFITLIREQGIHAWLYDEQRTMAELSFEYQDPAAPIGYVSNLARRLQEFPAQELLTAPYTYEDFDPALITRVLDELRPDNVLVTYSSRQVQGDRIDPWYGTAYGLRTITPERLAAWQTEVSVPALAIADPNPFIPDELAIKAPEGPAQPAGVPSASSKPQLLVDADGVRLWFKQDQEFRVPRANFYVYALSPLFNRDLRTALLAGFVVSLVNDQLNEYSYPANLAGAYFGLSSRARGFTLSVSGYDDKQPELLEALLRTLTEAQFSEERFGIIKTEMLRGWRNAELQTPYARLFQQAQGLLTQPYWSEQERIAAAQAIAFDDVLAFVPRLLAQLRFEVLYHGNVREADAQAMLDILTRYLPPDPSVPVPGFGSVVKLEPRARVVREAAIAHEDSAIVIYLQGVDDSLRTRALVSLLASIVRTPFYDSLRTEQQLGYIVNAGSMPILNVNGLVLYVESPSADPLQLEARIEDFLREYATTLQAMPQAQFEAIKAGVLTNLRQPPRRLEALSGRYWNDILLQHYATDSSLEMADAIEALTQGEVVDYYLAQVAQGGAGRLVARTAGTGMREGFLAARREGSEAVVLDDDSAGQNAFKQASEQYEFEGF